MKRLMTALFVIGVPLLIFGCAEDEPVGPESQALAPLFDSEEDDDDDDDAAGGDLAGTYPNPSVDGLQGNAVSGAAPGDGDVLSWNAANNAWEPGTPANGGSPSIAFNARMTASKSGPRETVIDYDVEILDDGNGLNPATGVYTAPVSGVYQFNFYVILSTGGASSYASPRAGCPT